MLPLTVLRVCYREGGEQYRGLKEGGKQGVDVGGGGVASMTLVRASLDETKEAADW